MKRIYTLLALGLVALLALSGLAMAKSHGRDDRAGDDHGHHARHDLRDDHGRHHGRHHHHRDRFLPANGTVASFDATTGKLAIALTGGETVTGLVTSHTEIRCESVAQRRDHGSDDHGGRDNEPGDDNGGHGEEPGDDNGGQFEPGDDHGGETPAGTPAPAEVGCGTSSLIAGATVGEAELRLEGGTAVFEEIELGRHS
jgi:hypothetical protein